MGVSGFSVGPGVSARWPAAVSTGSFLFFLISPQPLNQLAPLDDMAAGHLSPPICSSSLPPPPSPPTTPARNRTGPRGHSFSAPSDHDTMLSCLRARLQLTFAWSPSSRPSVSGQSVTDSCAWRKDKPQINTLSKNTGRNSRQIMQHLQEKICSCNSSFLFRITLYRQNLLKYYSKQLLHSK